MKNIEKILPTSSIRVLPEGIANRIAAGEVVERPASVAKELIENALDAEASHITLSVQKSGIDEILISDNGWGMDADDLPLAFRRHATSKISSAEDLLRITHLGFRGEALPSIASVARVEVISRREDRESGVRYSVSGGKPVGPEPVARERGTTVRVRTLFYNVPARRKFLRTPATEYAHIVKTFRQYALAYPEIQWTLIKDKNTVWNLQSTDLTGRISQLFGDGVLKDLHNVSSGSGVNLVEGIIGGTNLFKRSRGDQFLFINRRPIQNQSLHHAVVNGFGPLIHPGQVPFYVLFLRVDPEEFDVNVHPAKHEVRFRDEGGIYRMMLVATRDALGQSIRDGSAPINMNIKENEKQVHKTAGLQFPKPPKAHRVDGIRELELLFGRPAQDQTKIDTIYPDKPGKSHYMSQEKGDHSNVQMSPGSGFNRNNEAPLAGKHDPHDHLPLTSQKDVKHLEHQSLTSVDNKLELQRVNIWQLHQTYILSQVKSGLVIIDQHVAHERILFERALNAMQGRQWSGQQLLFPVEVKLDPAESAMMEEMTPYLARVGFDVEKFKDDYWLIRSFPSGIKLKNEEKLLREIIADYRMEHALKIAPEESVAASFACKAAIKAGDPLNTEEMNALIDELFQTQYPFVCPHGRPIVINLTLDEINKLFGRT
ncbi:MAG: DNA mismatch repair endonuclease MutL [Candidatus Electryonea clarkiae]|nr:DNA mismatch repair endonuclease MutL [Candidatus Electryonea clarkiae]MDP8285982.1 DNA mismatch repair endonuclease MutL [Candidatus Electryonea clarkiae]